MNKFGIIGYGIVGKATHISLLKSQPVLIHDISNGTNLSDLATCNYVFFCTPTDNEASIDTLIELIKQLKLINPTYHSVIRSTVPVGICRRIEQEIQDSILYIPEFLRDRCWEVDCLCRPIIIGSTSQTLPDWLSSEESILCSLEEAEIIKMFSNNIASSKIVLANHFYALSQSVGVDYSNVVNAYLQVTHDQNYLEANENLRGFGGKCLPKDLDFLISTLANLNLPQSYFTAMKEDNQLWPVTVRKS